MTMGLWKGLDSLAFNGDIEGMNKALLSGRKDVNKVSKSKAKVRTTSHLLFLLTFLMFPTQYMEPLVAVLCCDSETWRLNLVLASTC